jgi:sulfur carrier protein
MNIQVRLFATFRQGRFNRQNLDLPQGSLVQDLCRQLAIAPKDVAIMLVNGLEAPPDRELRETDTVSLFPGLGGG